MDNAGFEKQIEDGIVLKKVDSFKADYVNDDPHALVKNIGWKKPREHRISVRGTDVNLDKVTYSWRDINVHSGGDEKKKRKQKSKHILRNVSGVVHPGELLAIMGASGAGKTTLLNVLTYRNIRMLKVEGDKILNGVPAGASAVAALSAYVQQDDLFIGTLTVKEHLIFQALLRMDKHIPYEQRMVRVEEVIAELGLGKCENTLIGVSGRIKGISGGEMKRLSFASEILTNPPLMFCDEPTSGLDSYMAQNVVSVLKQMAEREKTIVCTIHQPSSEVFAMFDRILLMAEGRVAYLGSTTGAVQFFKDQGYPCPTTYNPSDFFILTLAVVPGSEEECRAKVENICDAYAVTDEGKSVYNEALKKIATDVDLESMDPTMKRQSPYRASWFAQFRAVLWRSWLSVIKDPMLFTVRLIQTIGISLLLGIIYFGQTNTEEGVMNINGALFLVLTNMTFQNTFAVVNVFCAELPIFLREHFNGMYRTDVYFLSKTFAELPVFIILPVIFISIYYYMVGLNPAVDRFFTALLIVVLVGNVACSFGYMTSCLAGSVTLALAIGPALIIPFMLFGGFFLNAGSVPVWLEWLTYISWFSYGNEALMINQWKGVDIDCTPVDNMTNCILTGEMVIQRLNYDVDNLWLDIGLLAVLLVGFRIIAYIALLSRTYRKR